MDEIFDDMTMRNAARWHTRLRALDCSTEERAAFARWHEEHPAHARAWSLAQRASGDLDALMGDARMQALLEQALSQPAQEQRSMCRRWLIPASVAASAVLGLIAVSLTTQLLLPTRETAAYRTSADQRQTVTLTDGSVVELDVSTRVAVHMSGTRREIELLQGRAMFDVAHDASRPFSVVAAGARTTALGTRFQVQSDRGRVLVTLTEGSVAVTGDDDASWHERLRPGEQLRFDPVTAAVDKQTVDVLRTTSWLRGRLVFRNTPLIDAVEEVNRYAKVKVRLGDATLESLPVGGSYIAGDSELVVEALTAVLPIRAADGGDEIILFRRYE